MAEKSERAQREEKILQFWKDNKIFQKTLDKKSPKGEFVFYEGPPTANGRPGIHHVEARAFKDAIPRYKTMQGYHVRRKAGWDTHGLPVELEVEKTLGLKSKKEIEAYGIAKFNEECKKSVWKYVDEWRNFTDRIGFWVDMDHPYVTYHNSYIEAVWSILAHTEKKNLLYKDYKVVPWCPRCGTALSSHELAQGYADVKDLSVYAKFKLTDSPSAYFLAWTTTPWTLPGNVALAVGKDIDYVEVKIGEEILVLAKDRLSVLTEPYKIVAEHKGSKMVGMGYEPLYPFLNGKSDRSFKVYVADFVNTEDGTGIVHTAVMYGQDDFVLGTKIGLPKHHLVDETGHFIPETGFLAGKFVKDEETAVEIIKDLAHRGLLFKKEKHEHSYPHCWRCKTPLIYYARDSWYIRMSDLRDELVSENKKIHWEPEHIKEGRFGEWLREVKDWAISRERYWGTPLPVWQNSDGSKRVVIDSIDTLKKYAKNNGNKYFVMRHGETEGNLKKIWNVDPKIRNPLTEKGIEEVKEQARKLLRDKSIDLILISPFMRVRNTAALVAKEIGLSEDKIITDNRLVEWNVGSKFNHKPLEDFFSERNKSEDRYAFKVEDGESYSEVFKRAGEFMYEIERKYADKNILIITHGAVTRALYVLGEGVSYKYIEPNRRSGINFKNAEIRESKFVPIPHNDEYDVDLHRPYVDDAVLVKEGEEYKRVKEVMDVWFDSGAVPFAQDPQNVIYPADFISEAIDQTRGWFYTLHAVGVLMDKGRAYKNVISLGHLLDKEGKKMSKSLGNIVNPWDEIDQYGVDSVRLWMYSVNQPGESKNYDSIVVAEIGRKVFNILDNVYTFYELYRDKSLESGAGLESQDVLDKWIIARLEQLIANSTKNMDNYKLIDPVRDLRDFIEDLSTWYLRRSRDRLKDGSADAKTTLYCVLKIFSKLLAPFAPFFAEDLYQKLKNDHDPESVHMCEWPVVKKSFFSSIFSNSDEKIISDMSETRKLVSLALEQRSKANIKVRQPLKKLSVKSLKLSAEYIELIKSEVNIKDVVEDTTLETDIYLDTTLTPELEEEGRVRDAIRVLQDMRKEKGLKPGDVMNYTPKDEEKELFSKYREEIEKATSIKIEG